jgi:DNA-binding NtrC family response regulator
MPLANTVELFLVRVEACFLQKAKYTMKRESMHLLLADDDQDDSLFFEEALAELPVATELSTVRDGEELMKWLRSNAEALPRVLFLDLNIPLKNGQECLLEIKQNKDFEQLIVVIITTSFEEGMINLLYKNGAQFYIRKPSNFAQLKNVILRVLSAVEEEISADAQGHYPQTARDRFVLSNEI